MSSVPEKPIDAGDAGAGVGSRSGRSCAIRDTSPAFAAVFVFVFVFVFGRCARCKGKMLATGSGTSSQSPAKQIFNAARASRRSWTDS